MARHHEGVKVWTPLVLKMNYNFFFLFSMTSGVVCCLRYNLDDSVRCEMHITRYTILLRPMARGQWKMNEKRSEFFSDKLFLLFNCLESKYLRTHTHSVDNVTNAVIKMTKLENTIKGKKRKERKHRLFLLCFCCCCWCLFPFDEQQVIKIAHAP